MRWLRNKHRRERVDLSEDAAFLLELLDNPRAWRERVVQDFSFSSSTHARLRSSYQVDLPPELVVRYAVDPDIRRANVLIPLTRRDKAPLLNFSLSGPSGSPAALLSRASTAALQAEYLARLAGTSAAASEIEPSIATAVYEAIGVFTPGLYRDSFLADADGDRERALLAYLQSGTGLPVEIAHVRRWTQKTFAAGQLLAAALDEPYDGEGASEELLLAVPRVDPLPSSIEDVGALVDGYLRGVLAANRADDQEFLATLAEYGRRYEVIVEVEIPLLEPSRLKIEEDIPLELAWRHRWTHRFPFGEARSAHLEARTLDPNVEIAGHGVVDPNGGDASGWLESVRLTRDALVVYSSEPERPDYVDLTIRFRGARMSQAMTAALIIVNGGALVAVLAVGPDELSPDRLAVLAIPTTVAAAFVLIREETTLAARVLRTWRGVLAAVTLLLWGVVAWGAVGSSTETDSPSGNRPTHRPESAAGSRIEPRSTLNGKEGPTWRGTRQEKAVE